MNDETQKSLDDLYRFTDFPWALEQGFTPTSGVPVSRQWGGKYRCLHCKSTGYINRSWVRSIGWWGHRHGNNCSKRVDRAV